MKRIALITVTSLALALVSLVVGVLVYLERDAWISSRRLSGAIHNARSVTFKEFTRGDSRESILAQKAATPEDIARLQRATNPWFLPYKPHGTLCFEPHHRVEIVRADGTECIFAVCFLCDDFRWDSPEASTSYWATELPPAWRRSLISFFTSIGMAPKTQEEYSAAYHTNVDKLEARTQAQ
jgi:hypothetical protein